MTATELLRSDGILRAETPEDGWTTMIEAMPSSYRRAVRSGWEKTYRLEEITLLQAALRAARTGAEAPLYDGIISELLTAVHSWPLWERHRPTIRLLRKQLFHLLESHESAMKGRSTQRRFA